MARRPLRTGPPRHRTDAPGINDQPLLTPDRGPVGRAFVPVVTPEQYAERRAFIESLLLSGMPNSRVVAICAQPYGKSATGGLTGLGVGPQVVVPICNEIRKQWADDYRSREATRRTDQLTCLQNDLARMRSQAQVPWQSVTAQEKLRAEIEGNLAPRRLEVGLAAVPDALAASIANMTEADCEAILAEELEREKKLNAFVTTAEASPAP